jgi:hypothetical protein
MRAFARRFVRALAFLLAIALPAAAQQGGDQSSDIGYPTVAAALEGLRAAGLTPSVQSGWTIFEDKGTLSVWSFAPPDDPAYPSAVRRTVVTKDSATFVNMQVHCEAVKAACDRLVERFNQLNRRVREQLQSK